MFVWALFGVKKRVIRWSLVITISHPTSSWAVVEVKLESDKSGEKVVAICRHFAKKNS